jgi:hypothetical protein
LDLLLTPPGRMHASVRRRRGLAEAAHKTNAWIFTCGERSNLGAQTAGHALAFGANVGYDAPVMAVVASGRMREDMSRVQNGKVHRYGYGGGGGGDGGGGGAAGGEAELDSRHSHFLVTDGAQAGATGLRDRLEYGPAPRIGPHPTWRPCTRYP